MERPKYFYMQQTGQSADIYIFGDITSWEWMESDVSSYTLARAVQALDADEITVHINSYGGEVAEGLAIYNSLKNSRAKIRTVCDGFACSAASVVFMAGDERMMNPASLLMIHNAWSSASGNAAELRKAADDLETISKTAAEAYKTRISLPEEELEKLLAEETWITPADAVAWGFATGVLDEEAAKGVNQSARSTVYQALTGVLQPKAAEPKPEPKPEPEPAKNSLLAMFGG